ncbi:hypothetical protein MIND_00394100 [Mycena indigotica]|uniref:Uncharacterized protein n=1 Tax=Mycena indigotica TaxID=2126181 RepID=A0A8H6T1C6_9AGAR|nr:uncharacterized protein MIND_00394100 [Mycena indigotica]KAF7310205.1 hypothetical protein MIND_00394100 [Mycena indigotica]
MAALFLHNSLWVPDPESPPPSVQHTHIPSSDYGPRHSQSLSHGRTTSASTLAGFSEASHPTQPLLRPASSADVAYLDLLARQPRHPSVRGAGPPPGLSFDGDPMTGRERKEMAERGIRRRLKREKRAVVGAEGVLGVWTVYCTTRYFVAYGHIPAASPAAEGAALALAAVSLAALALLLATALLPLIETHLLGRRTPTVPTVRAVRRGLRYFAAALLLAPAVANLVLALVWRRAGSASLALSVRCKLDVDVVWSVQERKECAPPPWVHWLILALLRLVLTLIVLIVYVVALTAYSHTRRPSAESSAASHRSLPSASSTLRNGPGPPLTPAPERRSLRRTRDRSQSQSNSQTRSRSRSRSRHHGSTLTTISYSSSSASSSSSGSDGEDEFDPYADLPPAPDRELTSFVDRFRSLVSQVGRDTAAGSVLPPASSASAFSASYAPRLPSRPQRPCTAGAGPRADPERVRAPHAHDREPRLARGGQQRAGDADGERLPRQLERARTLWGEEAESEHELWLAPGERAGDAGDAAGGAGAAAGYDAGAGGGRAGGGAGESDAEARVDDEQQR